MGNRVYITGKGLVSPLGNTVKENWMSILDARSNFSPYKIDNGKKAEQYYVGKVSDNLRNQIYSDMAEKVLNEALQSAGLDSKNNESRTVLIVGSSIGNTEYMFDSVKNKQKDLDLKEVFPEYLGYWLVEKYLNKSYVLTVNSACSSSTYAIGKGYQLIKDGEADIAYILGIDTALSEIGLKSFAALGVLAPEEVMRPFDVRHDGFILSEGAGCIILESEKMVNKSSKKVYGEIIGFGSSCDAYHIVAPDPTGNGAKIAMQKALKDAKISCCKIDYINCHGTGTKLNDESECNAMSSVFEETKILASSTKSLTGHLLGACGVAETIICCLALNNDIIPGTANLSTPMKTESIEFLKKNRKVHIDIAMNNTFAFGGQNASLIIKRGR